MSFFVDAHWSPEPAELVGVVGDNAVAVRYELAAASFHHVVAVAAVVSFVAVGDTEPASTVAAANLFAAVVGSTKVVAAAVAESYNEMPAELVV